MAFLSRVKAFKQHLMMASPHCSTSLLFNSRLQRPPTPTQPILHAFRLSTQMRPNACTCLLRIQEDRQSGRPWVASSRQANRASVLCALPSSACVELAPWLSEPSVYVIYARPAVSSGAPFNVSTNFSCIYQDPSSPSVQSPVTPHLPNRPPIEVPSPLQEPVIDPPIPPDASPGSVPEDPIPTAPTELPPDTFLPEVSPPTPTEIPRPSPGSSYNGEEFSLSMCAAPPIIPPQRASFGAPRHPPSHSSTTNPSYQSSWNSSSHTPSSYPPSSSWLSISYSSPNQTPNPCSPF